MSHFEPRGLGWLPSLPDFRDFAADSAPADAWLEQLRAAGAAPPPRSASVDLRDCFVDVDDQLSLHSSTAHACSGLVEYFERRANGRLLRPSRLFLYQNTLRLAGVDPISHPVDLRTTLKAMVRCGLPPERYWPYEVDRLALQPDPFLYSFSEPFRSVRYVRLDRRGASGVQTLQTVKAFLAAGFPSAFGFPVPNSLSHNPDIPYRPTFDTLIGGQAVIAVGYDDRWLRGSRGALLVRSSWGSAFGENGYAWLPYAYIEEQLAVDFWTLFHPDWITSGEFDLPEVPE
jgi:C1A family cysteine protease